MGYLLQAPEATVVLIRVKGDAPLLGTVVHCESEEGLVFPTVNLTVQGRQLPAVLLADAAESSLLQFELTDFTCSGFFADPARQQLAEVYRQACRQFGWQLDDSATLNIVYYLEAAGFSVIDNGNLQAAIDTVVVPVRQAFYRLIDVLAGAQQLGLAGGGR